MAEIDDALLSAIAATLLVEPRSSLQALAKAAGISRATLYRISPTREQLVELLVARSIALPGRRCTTQHWIRQCPVKAWSD